MPATVTATVTVNAAASTTNAPPSNRNGGWYEQAIHTPPSESQRLFLDPSCGYGTT
jgi:hypothetical protein